MKFIRFLAFTAATSFLAVSGIELTKVSSLHQTKKNASRALPSSSLNVTKDSIFYSPTSDEVKSYYSTINIGDKGDSFLTKLQEILKNGQKKVTYSSGDSASSTNWKGYYLYERDYSLSPLTASEVSSGSWKTSGIWINSLYCKSPIYVESGINSGTFKYYTDWNATTHSGSTTGTATAKTGSVQIDREHVFPKSNGFNGPSPSDSSKNELYKYLLTGCDAHNLRAGEHVGNSSAHSNIPYGNVADKNASTTTAYTSGITGECVGYVGKDKNGYEVYEPNDEDKGDIARTCFYMIARYHNYEVDPYNSSYHTPALTLADKVKASATKAPEDTASSPIAYGMLSDLLEWNEQDPVDDEEIRRNDLVYLGIQGNRNPFVDFPSWAKAAFSKSTVTFDDISIRKTYLGETTGGGSSSSSSSEQSSSSSKSSSSTKESSSQSSASDDIYDNTFTRFTSDEQLILGSKVAIVSSVAEYAAGAKNAYNYNRTPVSITKSDDELTISTPDEEAVYTLEAGYSDGTFSFKDSTGQYLAADSSDFGNLKGIDEKNEFSSWTIAFEDDGTSTITATAGTKTVMCHYSSSTRNEFNLYTKPSKAVCLYGYFEPDSFAKSEPKANLSFKFTDYSNEDGDYLMKDFRDVSMNLKLSYDFSGRTDYTSAGAIVKINGDESLYTGVNRTGASIESLSGNKTTWKDYSSSSYTVRISDIPSTAYNTNIMVVGYIQIDGLYHFTKPKTYSVVSLLNAYLESTDVVNYDNEDGTKTYVDVSDIARSFLDEINGGN